MMHFTNHIHIYNSQKQIRLYVHPILFPQTASSRKISKYKRLLFKRQLWKFLLILALNAGSEFELISLKHSALHMKSTVTMTMSSFS
jgi:hypothetical protein